MTEIFTPPSKTVTTKETEIGDAIFKDLDDQMTEIFTTTDGLKSSKGKNKAKPEPEKDDIDDRLTEIFTSTDSLKSKKSKGKAKTEPEKDDIDDKMTEIFNSTISPKSNKGKKDKK